MEMRTPTSLQTILKKANNIWRKYRTSSIPIRSCMNWLSNPTHVYCHFGHQISVQSVKPEKYGDKYTLDS